MQFFKVSPKNSDGIRKVVLPDSPMTEEVIKKVCRHSPTVKDRSAHELLLKDQIVTVIEKFPILNQDQTNVDTVAIGQRTYYRGKLLGKVKILFVISLGWVRKML